jgi:aryl-alcohol dehydrogenase-like predicted oxidoreductase
MDIIKLGKSDLKVSRIGLGGLQWGAKGIGIEDKAEIKKVINHALDSGINFLDTAESYADGMSEKMIGEVLRERGDRENVVVATKVHPFHLGFDNVLKACNASLRRLQTDHIDLYQVHHPSPSVPVPETMAALKELLKQGKVRYVGVSNFPVPLAEEAIASLEGHELITNQMEYNLLFRDIEKSVLQHAGYREMVILAYSPLSSGLLSGKYSPESKFAENDRRNNWPWFRNVENRDLMQPLIVVMSSVGEKHGASIPEVALNWILKKDNVIPLPGAKKPEHVDSHIRATSWKMSDDEYRKISSISDDLRLNTFYNFGNA